MEQNWQSKRGKRSLVAIVRYTSRSSHVSYLDILREGFTTGRFSGVCFWEVARA